MTLPNYYFPDSILKAQSSSMAVWPSGMVVPIWTEKAAYIFDTNTFAQLTLPPGATDYSVSPYVARTGHGYYNCTADGTGGVWLASNYGLMAYLPYPVTASGFTVSVPISGAIVGLTATGSSLSGNTAIAVDSSGHIFTTTSNHPGVLSTLPGGFGTLCKGATADSTNLYTTEPLVGRLGIMNLISRAFSYSVTPMTLPGIVSASSSGVVVAGWNYADIASGAVAFSASYNSPATLAAFAQPTIVALISGNDPTWSITSQLTGVSSCSSIVWNPDDSQILASVASGVTVIGVLGGNLIVDQNLSVSGAGNVAITPDGSNALVCVPGSNVITVLINNLDIWSVGTNTSITSPVATLLTGSTSGWALNSSNVYPLSRAGNVWTLGSAVALGFTGTAIAEDAYGTIYVTGGTGTTGYLAAIREGAITQTVTWTGNGYGISMAFELGQVAVLLSDNTTIRVFNAFDGEITEEGVSVHSSPTGCSVLGSTPSSLWLCGSSDIQQCWWTKPYNINRYRVGALGLYNGSSWHSATLGIFHDPAAVTWDVSGNIWAATVENDLYSFSGTDLTQLSHSVISDYTGQTANTMLGISDLVWWNGGLYASTLFAGAVVQVV